MEFCGEPKQATVQLNKDYLAIVNHHDKTVKVGCQTIPFEKVRELANKLGDA